MSIDQTDTIDIVAVDTTRQRVVLAIADHLDWDEDEDAHLLMLQDKLNTYLRFVEGGELLEKFPHSKGMPVTITLVGRFPLSNEAKAFFDQAKEVVQEAGLALEFELRADR